jgi:hypothetical protein
MCAQVGEHGVQLVALRGTRPADLLIGAQRHEAIAALPTETSVPGHAPDIGGPPAPRETYCARRSSHSIVLMVALDTDRSSETMRLAVGFTR